MAFQTATGYQTYDNVSTSFTVTLSGTTTTVGSFSFPLGGEQPYTLLVYGTTLSPVICVAQRSGRITSRWPSAGTATRFTSSAST